MTDLAFSVSGKLFASASADCQVRIWDVATGGLLRPITTAANNTPRRVGVLPRWRSRSEHCLGSERVYGFQWIKDRSNKVSHHNNVVPEAVSRVRVDSNWRLFAASGDGSVRLLLRPDLGNANGYKSVAIATGEFGPALAHRREPGPRARRGGSPRWPGSTLAFGGTAGAGGRRAGEPECGFRRRLAPAGLPL